jgi:hypothetical protein
MDTITPTASDLDKRIAAAFGDGVTSEHVKELIVEAEAASVASGEGAERARERALDPTLTAKVVAEARREMEDSAFRRERLENAVTRLRDRLNVVLADEEDERRLIAYEKVKSERDKLAAELKAIYPPFEAQLRDLMPRIEANDREIDYVNRHTPRGANGLSGAEQVARGLRGFVEKGVDVPRITQRLRLPAFQYDQFEPYAWPRQR